MPEDRAYSATSTSPNILSNQSIMLDDYGAPPVDPQVALFAALVAAQSEVEHVTKDSTADTGKYSYKYADLAAVQAIAKPVLAKYGLGIVYQPGRFIDGCMHLTTIIIHTGGGRLESLMSVPVPAEVRNDGRVIAADAQDATGAVTTMRRYSLLAALNMATEDDDSGGGHNQQRRQNTSWDNAPQPPQQRQQAAYTGGGKFYTPAWKDSFFEGIKPMQISWAQVKGFFAIAPGKETDRSMFEQLENWANANQKGPEVLANEIVAMLEGR